MGNGREGKIAVFDKEMVLTAGKIGREDAEDIGGGSGNRPVIGVEDLDADPGERFEGEGIENQTQRTTVAVSQMVEQADEIEGIGPRSGVRAAEPEENQGYGRKMSWQ